jgi:hypothetical protein
MRMSVLAISFVEPKKPDPRHRRKKEKAGPASFRFLSISRVHVARVRRGRSYDE